MNELSLVGMERHLSSDHAKIANDVAAWLPEANEAMRPFGKTQSQFMDHVLTVSHPTPLRNLHQILAQVEKCQQALRENIFRLRKSEVEVRRVHARLQEPLPELDRQWLTIDLEEKQAGLAAARLYLEGCIRQIAGYRAQYESICQEHGLTSFDEIDFEHEEARYHVMTAFRQALCAARSRDGLIDEGNHIYLHQIGVNGAQAQNEIDRLLKTERELLAAGGTISPKLVCDWLERMADTYAYGSAWMREHRGMIAGPVNSAALTSNGEKP